MSLYIIIVSMIILWVCGYPLYYWGIEKPHSKKGLDITLPKKEYIALVPIIGFAALTTILKIITMLNIPLKYSSFPVLFLFIGLFVFCVLQSRGELFQSNKKHKNFFIGLGAVLIISGIGFYIIGVQEYRGYNVWDLTFYLPQSQFYIEQPINLAPDAIPNVPWHSLVTVKSFLNTNRISRGVFQGFITVVSGISDATYTYGLMVVLASVLIYCVVSCLLDSLPFSKRMSLIVSVWASVFPSIMFLSLDGFISPVLSIGFVMLSGWAAHDLAKHYSVRKMIVYAIIFASGMTIYSEMIYLMIGIAAVVLLLAILSKELPAKNSIWYSIQVCILAFILNIQLTSALLHDLSPRWVGEGSNYLDIIYEPIAYNSRGLVMLFFGFDSIYLPSGISTIAGFICICLFVAAVTGVILLFIREQQPWVISMLCIIVFPFIFVANPNDMSTYKFYRMLLMAGPVLVIGLSYFLLYLYRHLTIPILKLFTKIATVALISTSLLVSGVESSGILNYRGANFSKEEYIFLEDLKKTSGKNMYIVSEPGLMQSWSIYYARNNKLWLSSIPWERITWVSALYDQGERSVAHDSYYNYNSIPLENVQIIYTPKAYNPVTDEQTAKELGVYIANESYVPIHDLESEYYLNQYHLSLFSTQARTVTLFFTAQSDGDEEEFEIQFNDISYTFQSGKTQTVILNLEAGSQDISIYSPVLIDVIDYSITPELKK